LLEDERYLDKACTYADKLSEIGTRANNGIYIPYRFNYGLHNNNSDEIMMAPWYSGYAQCYALALVSRIYEVTNDTHYKAFADSIFNTFLASDTTLAIWTTAIDSLGYFWIEEYPFNPRTRVLNGFFTATFGLYEYYMASNNEYAGIVINGSISTLAHYIPNFRVPGGISYYCLAHLGQYGSYHTLHIRQMRFLSTISNNEIFNDYADSLESDY